MSSRRFWVLILVLLAIADLAVRWMLRFDFNSILLAESLLFTFTAAVLLARMRREDSEGAWPRWVRLGIAVFLLLGAVRAVGYSAGLSLFASNLLTLGLGIIVIMIMVVGRRRIERWRSSDLRPM